MQSAARGCVRLQSLAVFVRSIGKPNSYWTDQARKSNTEIVQGTRHALAALLKERGVKHGCGKILVPEQVLNGADVGAALEQVRGKGVAKGMGADGLRQTGTADRDLDGVVDDAGINMMTACDTSTRVSGEVPGGEDRRPAPLLGGMGILPIQRMGQVDLTMALSQILLGQRPDSSQVILKPRRSVAGTVVNQSLSPLPERTVSGFIWKSMSWTLSRTASLMRQPLP